MFRNIFLFLQYSFNILMQNSKNHKNIIQGTNRIECKTKYVYTAK